MATLAIGDLHGNLMALDSLLEKTRPHITDADTVVFVGDYIDRGPNARGCLDRLIEFKDGCPAEVVCLMGNHEETFLRTLDNPAKHSWVLAHQGLATMASYSTDAADYFRSELRRRGAELILDPTPLPYEQFFSLVPASHLQFLRSLAPYFRMDDTVVVHAGVSADYTAVEKEPPRTLRWGGDGFPDSYSGSDTIIYGHHHTDLRNKHGWPQPRVQGRTIGIDTIGDGVLTGIWQPSGIVIQSDRHLHHG